MTANELALLALGLACGVAGGAALVIIFRKRPPAKREVRVTVTQNAVARRSATLADDSATPSPTEPARGGPGDILWAEFDAAVPLVASGDGNGQDGGNGRTHVPVEPGGPFRLADPRNGSVGISIAHEADPMMAALQAAAWGSRVLMPSGIETSAEAAVRLSSVTTVHRPDAISIDTANGSSTGNGTDAATADVATRDRPVAEGPAHGPGGGRPPAGGPAKNAAPDRADAIAGACDEPRRIADERCLVAARAREGAETALATLRAAQRAYDEHLNQAEAQSDPRTVRAAKEAAQDAFRVARAASLTRDDLEAAAREWLTEINRINLATREAIAQAERHRLAAAELAMNLERLSVEADAARISAESAEEACIAAREALAACQEAATILAASGRRSSPPTVPPPGRALPVGESPDEDPSMASRAGEDAVIIRLLRGDREAMNRLVARLGGDDVAERRRWQRSIGELLEAFVARSIEASAFDFPTAHPFWGAFTKLQCRDIAGGLSSLGYRHDGFGAWADDHMPTRRDLTLAVGYAGLDPMRIRHWPSEAEMRDLLKEVTVAADEYIWEAAGALTLGELVSLLGRRADGLTELWNEWGVVRPMLLSAE